MNNLRDAIVEQVKTYCKYPIYVKGRSIYVHPKDIERLNHRTPFISPIWVSGKEDVAGWFLGYTLFVQDDIMRIILALVEGNTDEG